MTLSGRRASLSQVLSLLAFPSTTVQIQTPEALRARQADARPNQVTCFTSTKVQILTPERDRQERDTRQHCVSAGQGFGEAGATFFCLHCTKKKKRVSVSVCMCLCALCVSVSLFVCVSVCVYEAGSASWISGKIVKLTRVRYAARSSCAFLTLS